MGSSAPVPVTLGFRVWLHVHLCLYVLEPPPYTLPHCLQAFLFLFSSFPITISWRTMEPGGWGGAAREGAMGMTTVGLDLNSN